VAAGSAAGAATLWYQPVQPEAAPALPIGFHPDDESSAGLMTSEAISFQTSSLRKALKGSGLVMQSSRVAIVWPTMTSQDSLESIIPAGSFLISLRSPVLRSPLNLRTIASPNDAD